jgi:hypothetical protein
MYNIFGEQILENPFENFKTFEKHLESLLKQQKLLVESQRNIGKKPNGRAHVVDILANGKIIVSAKLQNTIGTAEDKVPYEQIILQQACSKFGLTKAYIVCAGTGWTLLDYFVSDEYQKTINTPDVIVLKYDDFLKVIPTL